MFTLITNIVYSIQSQCSTGFASCNNGRRTRSENYIKRTRTKMPRKPNLEQPCPSKPNLCLISIHFHPTPFQHAEQPAIFCTCSIDTNHIRPECFRVRFRRAHARRFPTTEVSCWDTTEQHEYTRDNIWRGGYVHRCCLLPRLLSDETQCNVSMLLHDW